MRYVLIRGPSYTGLDFVSRERVREGIRKKLETEGIRFLEYNWVWNEQDDCLLLVGQYDKIEHAHWWIKALEAMGFELCVRSSLPGNNSV